MYMKSHAEKLASGIKTLVSNAILELLVIQRTLIRLKVSDFLFIDILHKNTSAPSERLRAHYRRIPRRDL
jgi:hypothetical protein